MANTADALCHNHTLLGVHLHGNWGNTFFDANGFAVETEPPVVSESQTSSALTVGRATETHCWP